MDASSEKKTKKFTGKRIAALIGVILLALLYLATLITALFDTTQAHVLFRMSLIATFAIPLLIWVYIWMYGKLTGKHTIADFHTAEEKNTPPLE